MAEPTRWINQRQPQTLYMATILLYIDAALGVLFGTAFSPIGLAYVAGSAAGAYGIANEKNWGYWLAVGISTLYLLFITWFLIGDLGLLFNLNFLISLIFPLARFLLLMHPQSREYQRIWFS
jgi:hypothetical protein